jgi:hypothetical protein
MVGQTGGAVEREVKLAANRDWPTSSRSALVLGYASFYRPAEEGAAMCLSQTLEATRQQPTPAASLPHAEPSPGLVSRRGLLFGAGAAALTMAAPAPAPALAGGRHRSRVRDLTHLFREGFPMYVGDPPDRRTIRTFERDGYYAQAWEFGEHSGTHMDAPGHFVPGGRLTPSWTPRSCSRRWR